MYKKVGYTVIVLVSLKCLKNIWDFFRYFKVRGIPGPEPSELSSFVQFSLAKSSLIFEEFSKKYGQTFGIYRLTTPLIVTSDLDIIQEVCIKQFQSSFPFRKPVPMDHPESSEFKNLVTVEKYNRWKRMRLVINPSFSAAKIREMRPLLETCVDRLINQFNKTEEELDMKVYLKRFTMDSIWNCAFGLDIDMQNNPENVYLLKSFEFVAGLEKLNIFAFLSLLFPSMNSVLIPLEKALTKSFGRSGYLEQKVSEIVTTRQKLNINRRDFMQLLLEALSEDEFSSMIDEMHSNDGSVQKKLSRGELESNLVIFMIAGYETTSTALTNASHVLATHPEIQQKLFDEIHEHFGDSVKPDTDNVKDLVYLDNFVKELLRFHPIAGISRICTKETVIKGIKFSPGAVVRVNSRAVSFSQEIWGPVDPYVFDPTRHEVKRNPLGSTAFGLGPRNCAGMKFALIEMKLALVKLVLKFEFKRSASTPDKLTTFEGQLVRPQDFTIVLKKREYNSTE